MLGGADNPNGELPSYITGANRGFLVFTGGPVRYCLAQQTQRVALRRRFLIIPPQ